MARILIIVVSLLSICSISFAAISDDLVLSMTFDSNTIAGTEVKDLSKYGNKGKLIGAPKVVAGHRGNALDFNGTTDSVEIPTSASLAQASAQITMESWLFTRADAQIEVLCKWDGTLNGMAHFELQAGGIIRFCIRKADAAADAVIIDLKTPAGKFKLNEWVHIAQTYDGKTARIYVNGTEVLNGAATGNLRDNKDVKYWIGSLYTTQGRWYSGLLDDVRIWSRALTAEEVKGAMDGTLIASAVEKDGKLASAWGYLKAIR